ncbi:hypothetical protein J3E69DRAFT_322276 [Trichoderma sp. SZMC 28015]
MRTPPSLRQAPASALRFCRGLQGALLLVRQVHVLVTCTNLARCAHPQVPLHFGAGTCRPWWRPPMSCQLSHRPCFSTLPPFSLLSSACVQFPPLHQLGPMGAVRKGKPTIFSLSTPYSCWAIDCWPRWSLPRNPRRGPTLCFSV